MGNKQYCEPNFFILCPTMFQKTVIIFQTYESTTEPQHCNRGSSFIHKNLYVHWKKWVSLVKSEVRIFLLNCNFVA